MTDAPKLDPRETHASILPYAPSQLRVPVAIASILPYAPSQLRVPVAIIRATSDSTCTDADAAWLLSAIPTARDTKLPRATHLMHLEENRYALYRETEAFLKGD